MHVKDEAERDALFDKPSVKRWLNGIERDSWYKQVNVLHRFLLYRRRQNLGHDPDEMVDQVRKGANEVRIAHLQVLLDWLQGDDEDVKYAGASSRKQYFKAVKSFYRHNLVDLPMGTLQVTESEEEASEIPDEPTATEFLELARRVVDSGQLSIRDRSIVLTKVQGFMDNKTLCRIFNYVAFPQLARHFGTQDFRLWDENKVPVRIDLKRTKTKILHFTALHRDAITEPKAWLKTRERQFGPIKIYPAKPGTLPRSDPIYVSRSKEVRPIRQSYVSIIFNRSGKRSGVNEPSFEGIPQKRRYPFHSHEVRDVAITLSRKAGVDREVVDFMAGHEIDEDGYDKSPKDNPQWFLEGYDRLARRFLNLISGGVERAKLEAEGGYEQRLKGRDKKIEELEGKVRVLDADRENFDKEKASWEERFVEFKKDMEDLIRAREKELREKTGSREGPPS